MLVLVIWHFLKNEMFTGIKYFMYLQVKVGGVVKRSYWLQDHSHSCSLLQPPCLRPHGRYRLWPLFFFNPTMSITLASLANILPNAKGIMFDCQFLTKP